MNDLGLSAVQEGWARKILAIVKGHQLGTRYGIIAIECAMDESRLRMQANKFNPDSLALPHDAVGHDHGSVGLFQQQVGGAPNSNADWGTTAQLMDVHISTHKFLKALLHVDLDLVTNWRACQIVQNSAVASADNYRSFDALATRVVDAFWDDAVPDTTGRGQPAAGFPGRRAVDRRCTARRPIHGQAGRHAVFDRRSLRRQVAGTAGSQRPAQPEPDPSRTAPDRAGRR